MKYLLFILGLLLTNTSYCKIDTLKVSSKISDVTVFFNGAQINREAQLSVSKGKYLLFFNELPKEINPQSIQVKGLNGVKILSVKHEINNPDQKVISKKENQILEEIDRIKDTKNQLQEQIQVFDIEEDILLDNSRIYKGTEGTSVEKIKATADFYRNRLNEIRKGKLDLQIQQKGLKTKMESLYKKLNELTVKKRKSYSQLQVAIECLKKPTKPLVFTYYISSAGWVPTYDFRVTDITKPLTLVYRANVFQSSGEDWKQVDVVLSSNNPMLSGNKPSMGNLYLNRNSQHHYANTNTSGAATIRGKVIDYNGEAVPFCNVMLMQNGQQIIGTTTDFDGNYTIKPVPPGKHSIEFSYVGFQTKKITGIYAQANQTTAIDAEMDKGIELASVEIAAYDRPLFRKDQMTTETVTRRQEIKSMAVRSVADIAHTSGDGIYSRDNGNGYINARGNRANNSVTYVDGIKLLGSTHIPKSHIEEVSVNVGGRSAQYGDGDYSSWENVRSSSSRSKSSYLTDKSLGLSNISLLDGVKSRTTHLEYNIPIPYTIPSDGEDYSLQIKEVELDVEYIYYAVPKLDKDAFLTARINNWNELNLLSGKTSIYYEGTFTGESYLDAQQADDTISVSLGRDKSIFLSRSGDKTVYDKVKIGKNMKETLGWKIVVKNNKRVPITIFVEDQYPLSDRKSIEVELGENSNAKVNKRKGKLSWELKIDPATKKEINFSYSVSYPKYSNLLVQ